MADIYGIVKKSDLTNLADTIRDRTGVSGSIRVSEMASRVASIGIGQSVGDYWNKRLTGVIVDNEVTTCPNMEGQSGITGVVFPKASSFTKIGNSNIACFKNCYNLEFVSLDNNNITFLPSSNFMNCYKLKDIDFPNVTLAEYGVFISCSSLESVNLPRLSSLPNIFFSGCYNLKNVNIPEISRLGYSAFYKCSNISSLSFSRLLYLETEGYGNNYAFASCTSLEYVNLGLCTNIRSYTFSGCTNLKSVECKYLTFIWNGAFAGCNNLENLSNKYLSSVYDTGQYKLSSETFSKVQFWYYFNMRESNIRLDRLYGANNMIVNNYTEISMPALTYWQSTGLQGLTNLIKAYLPQARFWGGTGNFFENCTQLVEVTFGLLGTNPNNSSVFKGCSNLLRLNILTKPSAYQSISTLWFVNTPITNSTYLGVYGSIYVPSKFLNSYKTLSGWSRFSSRYVALSQEWDDKFFYGYEYAGDNTVTDIESLKPSAEFINEYAFSGCTNLSVLSHSNVKYINNNIISTCNINTINLPKVKVLPPMYNYLFNSNQTNIAQTSYLKNLTAGVEFFAGDFFDYGGYQNLSFMSLSECTAINRYFRSMYSLETVYLPNLEIAPNGLFSQCSRLSYLDLPKLEYCSLVLATYCSNLSYISAPELKIVEGVIANECSNLTSFYAPKLSIIYNYTGGAFNVCSSLRNLSLPELTELKNTLVANNMILDTMYVPKLTSISSYIVYGVCYSATVGLSYISAGKICGNNISVRGFVSASQAVSMGTFNGCSYLEYIDIGQVTSLPSNAFSGCISLNTISLSNKITYLGSSALYRCLALNDIDLTQCGYIGDYGMYQCASISTITTKTGYIGSYAMQNCYNLVSLYLTGSSVVEVGTNPFDATPLNGNSVVTSSSAHIYVPSSLYNDYLANSFWSSYASRLISM